MLIAEQKGKRHYQTPWQCSGDFPMALSPRYRSTLYTRIYLKLGKKSWLFTMSLFNINSVRCIFFEIIRDAIFVSSCSVISLFKMTKLLREKHREGSRSYVFAQLCPRAPAPSRVPMLSSLSPHLHPMPSFPHICVSVSSPGPCVLISVFSGAACALIPTSSSQPCPHICLYPHVLSSDSRVNVKP